MKMAFQSKPTEAQNLIDKLKAAGILPQNAVGGSNSSSSVSRSHSSKLQQGQPVQPSSSSRAVGVVIGQPVAMSAAASRPRDTTSAATQHRQAPGLGSAVAGRVRLHNVQPAANTSTSQYKAPPATSGSSKSYKPFDWEKAASGGLSSSLYRRESSDTSAQNPPGPSHTSSYEHSSGKRREYLCSSPTLMAQSAPVAADPQKKLHFNSIKYIMECGTKLGMSSELVAIASCVYHGFYERCTSMEGDIIGNYDPHLISATALYIATKVGEELTIKLRDIVNVCYRTVRGGTSRRGPGTGAVLDIGEEYWNLRDSVVHCELLVLRMLQFRTEFPLPHRYLLHYMKSLRDWVGDALWTEVPITEAAWSFLRDAYFHPALALEVKPHHLATAVLYLTVTCYGVPVAYDDDAEQSWWQVFASDLSERNMYQICQTLMKVYKQELQVIV